MRMSEAYKPIYYLLYRAKIFPFNNVFGYNFLIQWVNMRIDIINHGLCHNLELWGRNALLDGQQPSPVRAHAPHHSFHGMFSKKLEPKLWSDLKNVQARWILCLFALFLQFNGANKQEFFFFRDGRLLAHGVEHLCILDVQS